MLILPQNSSFLFEEYWIILVSEMQIKPVMFHSQFTSTTNRGRNEVKVTKVGKQWIFIGLTLLLFSNFQIKGPTTNLYKLVISRLLGVMSVFCSSILLTMCILFRPWKVESYAGKNAEFSIWKVCRADKKKEKCFPGYYEKNAHGQYHFVYVVR